MRTGTKTLETPRLILRQFTLKDAHQMFKNYCNDFEVCKYVTWNEHGKVENTREYLKTFVFNYADTELYRWAIVLKETSEVVGAIDAVKVDHENKLVEIGWVLAKRYWSQGLMTEAGKTIVAYLFDQGFEIIHAKFDARNIGSGKVMSKIGMYVSGLEKDVAYKDKNDKVDLIHFELSKKNYNVTDAFEYDYEKFLNKWGQETQLRMAIEEMSELTKEICKYIRYSKDVSPEIKEQKLPEIIENLKSEVADTLNCVEQVRFMFDKKSIDQIRKQKMDKVKKNF